MTTAETIAPIPSRFSHTRYTTATAIARRTLRSLQQRYDDHIRRELSAGHEAFAKRYEIGGDFSLLP
jgi:hypothetical protein